MEKDSVYIILVNYNGVNDTIACIESIKKNEHNCEYKIIVVDNNSTDNSVEILSKNQDIHFIESHANNGFAIGNNIGIDYALKDGADYILLLNNDTIITENSISKLLNALKQNEDIGIVGCRIMYDDNKELINYCGGRFNWYKGITVHEHYKQKFNNDMPECMDTEFITGCCMLITKEVFEKVGYLPEEYFMYFEDADFCMKVRNANYKLKICTNVVIYHKVSSSSGGEYSEFAIKWITRNRLIFLDKYKNYIKGKGTLAFVYFSRFVRYIQYMVMGQKGRAKAILTGIKEGRNFIKVRDKK